FSNILILAFTYIFILSFAEERIEEQLTYWIYQYEHFGRFKGEIPDCELLERDIKKIKSMITLRFEDLECYKTGK
ncbi:hypothetical protein, partial [uncultured Catenibacterium sp.]|uniref:hypothetical protein n=1 Tax=uncultured Catenibacterium sp. TaxID=286142 RepID=UPI002606F5BE